MHVVVMGGSLGGLSVALWLRDAGCDVDVHERSHSPLEGRGAGIVLHPAVLRYFTQYRVLNFDRISAAVRCARYRARAGTVAHEVPARYRFTSWTALYQALLRCVDPDRYHLGNEIIGFNDDADGVNVRLEGGRCIRCDLLVCADGVMSTARQILLPGSAPQYAGYVAWRGTVEAEELAQDTWAGLHEAVTYFLLPNSHILAYPIPRTDDVPTSARPINWVWYRNVEQGHDLDGLMTDPDGSRRAVSMPPGQVCDAYLRDLREAAADLLPSALAEVVTGTAKPFLQMIVDAGVPRMAFGRICLIGDAAFALRPHVAAGTAKAAEDAWQLAHAVKAHRDDVVAALKRWEPGQLTLGRQVSARSREAGMRLQIEGTWQVGEPLPFGLYRVGDSTEIDLGEAPASAPDTNRRTCIPRSLQ